MDALIEFLASSWPVLAIIVVFYLFFIRPQVKKQKQQQNFLESLEKGKEVVTGSGIVGRINKIEDDVVNLQVDNKTYIKVLKSALSREMTEQYEEESN